MNLSPIPGDFHGLREVSLVRDLHHVAPHALVVAREHRRCVFHPRGTGGRWALRKEVCMSCRLDDIGEPSYIVRDSVTRYKQIGTDMCCS